MATLTESPTRTARPIADRSNCWLPLIVLPTLAAAAGRIGPPWWRHMWLLAVAFYAGLKWLTYCDAGVSLRSHGWRALAYLCLWPGMNARAFFDAGRTVPRPGRREWLAATFKTLLGCSLFFAIAPQLLAVDPLVAGWVAMAGIVFTLHFGLFHLLSLLWRRLGIDAPPIMNSPLLATSLGDFWGRRWNIAFRDLSYEYVIRPYASKIGLSAATVIVFLISGLVHDAVISIPARGGYGLPTLYFMIHAAAQLFERARRGRRIGLGRGAIGWTYTVLVSTLPAGLLFHRPFVDNVILPMVETITRFGN